MTAAAAAAVSWAIFFVALLQIARSSQVSYEVPEPLFEVFSPRGLRISIADSRNVETVEFILNVPGIPDALVYKALRPERGLWTYWNPDVVVGQNEKIHFKIVVKHDGDMFCSREGVHYVRKVTAMSGRINDTENEGQRVITGFPSFDHFGQRAERMTSGKSSNFKSSSSYSTYTDSDSKPITKSSMTTTSGTFYVKPSGVMEATGFKSGSKFDSTKNEGEQWEHYRTDLTTEELERMKHMYESGMFGFRDLEKMFPDGRFPGFPHKMLKAGFEGSPMGEHRFHETHETHEESSFTQSRPTMRFQFGDSHTGTVTTANNREEKTYRVDSTNGLPKPLPSHGAMFKATEYVREEHTGSGRGDTPLPLKLTQTSSQTQEFSQNQEEVRPVYTHSTTGSNDRVHQEFSLGSVKTVDNRQDYRSRSTYNGNIFKTYRSVQPNLPQECAVTPHTDYTPAVSLRELEKFVYELSCLASLAEKTMKDEVWNLKQKNSELMQKLESVQQELKRLDTACHCY